MTTGARCRLFKGDLDSLLIPLTLLRWLEAAQLALDQQLVRNGVARTPAADATNADARLVAGQGAVGIAGGAEDLDALTVPASALPGCPVCP